LYDFDREIFEKMSITSMATKPTGNPPGAPDPGANRTTHGIVALRNQIKRRVRRGRSLIDRRSRAGQNAVAMRQELITDQGGEEYLSVAKLALIEMIARDVYFLDECDRRIFKAIYHRKKKQHPRLIATMYGYRSTVARNLAGNLALLGLEKVPPPAKTLEQILNEPEEEQP
jgi:hypothetical protein